MSYVLQSLIRWIQKNTILLHANINIWIKNSKPVPEKISLKLLSTTLSSKNRYLRHKTISSIRRLRLGFKDIPDPDTSIGKEFQTISRSFWDNFRSVAALQRLLEVNWESLVNQFSCLWSSSMQRHEKHQFCIMNYELINCLPAQPTLLLSGKNLGQTSHIFTQHWTSLSSGLLDGLTTILSHPTLCSAMMG